jgi:hypothetical protein
MTLKLKNEKQLYYIIDYRNMAGSWRQTGVMATQQYEALQVFKDTYGKNMDPEHCPLSIKEKDQGVTVNHWYMENAYKGLPERRNI